MSSPAERPAPDLAARPSTDTQEATAAGRSAAVSLPFRPFRGDLDWPVDGRVVMGFGASRGASGVEQNGVEVSAIEGASVRAVHGGTVAYADTFTGYGYLVIIDHGENAFSLYGYLGSVSVQKGDGVETHAVLGAARRPPARADTAGLLLEFRVKPR